MSIRANFTTDHIISNGWMVDARAYGPSTSKTAIDAAVTAIGTNTRTLLLAPGTWTIDDDLTFAENVYVHFAPGAQLSIDSGKTVTFHTPSHVLAAATQDIFSGDGDVTFTNSGIVQAGWWGASTSAGASVNTAAINAALNCMDEKDVTVKLAPGT